MALIGDAVAEVVPFDFTTTAATISAEGGDPAIPASGPHLIPGVRDTRYFENVLSAEECSALVQSIAASRHLSFWNSDESKRDTAKLFRDADTIEVDSPEFAQYMWSKIESLIDFKRIVIGISILYACLLNE